jgi:hypothetical protein
MYISDLKLFFYFMMMFQKYSELCLLTSRPVRQETMQVEEGEGDVLDKAIFNKVNVCSN